MRYLIWDFDRTLGYREGSFTGTLAETLSEEFQGREEFQNYEACRDHVRPHLQTGFPWHNPEHLRPANENPEVWWERLYTVFERAYSLGCNVDQPTAKRLAQKARVVFLREDRWRLYDDSIEGLQELAGRGWRHIMLSNHVPELSMILQRLEIAPFFEHVFNSAETGVEKPHPNAFANVLAVLPEGAEALMIGDNIVADVQGASSCGIQSILLRKDHPEAAFRCADIGALIKMLDVREQRDSGCEVRSKNAEVNDGTSPRQTAHGRK